MDTGKTYAEIITSEYAPKETRKVVALKKLDTKAKLPANVFGYTFGIVMALVLGTGMSLALKVIGDGSNLWFILGIIIGVVGIIGISINYPIYKKLLENGKKKYGNDIMNLAKEITEEN